MDFAGRSLRTTSDAPSRSWKMSSFELQMARRRKRRFLPHVHSAAPCKEQPCEGCQTDHLGTNPPNHRRHAFPPLGLTVAGSMQKPVDFVESHDDLPRLSLNPPSEGTTAP